MAWNPSVGKESPRRPPLSQGVELRVIFIAFEYEIGERNGARREMGISWGETSDNQRRGEYAGHCEPGQDPPPTSVGGHLCEFTGRERGDSARGATRNVAPLARGIGRFSQERGSAVPSKVKRTRVTFLCSNFSLQRNEWR